MGDEPSNLLTTGQAAKLCSVTPDTILKWIRRGRLPARRTAGGHFRVQRRHLDPLIRGTASVEAPPPQIPECFARSLRCWEYLSDQGAVREDCRQCLVYRVRAARCFLMADMGSEIGHARRFCQSSCQDCVYYRRVNGLATNVLLITADEGLGQRLGAEENDSITLRLARNGYEASAIIHDFRPAFAVIDEAVLDAGEAALLDSLGSDPRVAGLRIILAVRRGMGRKPDRPPNKLIGGVIEAPFTLRQIEDVIDAFPVDSLSPGDDHLQGATRKEEG